MELLLTRDFRREHGVCFGRITTRTGDFICYTLEPPDYGFDKRLHDVIDIRKAKARYDKMAIPKGTYTVALNRRSTKFGDIPFYFNTCKGLVPRLLSVPGFDGILIHCGNTLDDTSGCILVGTDAIYKNGTIEGSTTAFEKLYNYIIANMLPKDTLKLIIRHCQDIPDNQLIIKSK